MIILLHFTTTNVGYFALFFPSLKVRVVISIKDRSLVRKLKKLTKPEHKNIADYCEVQCNSEPAKESF